MKLTLEEKVQITQHVVNELNRFWIKYQGDLYNHEDFWNQTLHAFSNEDWEIFMDVMDLIRLEDPNCYLPGSISVFQDVRKELVLKGHVPRCLDTRKNKKTEFKALMHIKDVFNNLTGYIPPTKFNSKPLDLQATPFERLFDFKDNNASSNKT